MDINELKVEINLMENMLYIVKDGTINSIETPPNGHGKQTITWANGKPINIENYFTRKI